MIDGHAKVGNDECPISQQLADKKTTKVVIEMHPEQCNVLFNGKKMCTEKRADRRNFPKATVFASDPWYNPALAKIRNFQIRYSPPPHGTVLFQKKGTFTVKRNTRIGKCDLMDDYAVSFDLTPSGVAGGWRSIVHFTTSGNCCGYGQRIPGVWFYSNTRRLLIVDGHTSNGNDYCTGGAMDAQLADRKTTKVHIEMRKYAVDIYTNGKKICTKRRQDRKLWRNVEVWGSDPWYAAAQAKVGALRFLRLRLARAKCTTRVCNPFVGARAQGT